MHITLTSRANKSLKLTEAIVPDSFARKQPHLGKIGSRRADALPRQSAVPPRVSSSQQRPIIQYETNLITVSEFTVPRNNRNQIFFSVD